MSENLEERKRGKEEFEDDEEDVTGKVNGGQSEDSIGVAKKKAKFSDPEDAAGLKSMLAGKDNSLKAIKWLANLEDCDFSKQIIHDYVSSTDDFSPFHRLLNTSPSIKNRLKTCTAIEATLLFLANHKDLAVKFATAATTKDSIRSYGHLLGSTSGQSTVLKLLTALIVTSGQIADSILQHLNWDQFKKGITSQQAQTPTVRSCLGYFALALFLLVDEKNEKIVTNAIGGKARVVFDQLFAILPVLAEEDQGLVTLIFDTILKKIVENSKISKTTKMKLFNETSIEKILQLFQTNTTEELQMSALNLLKRILTDTKLGIVFNDQKFINSESSATTANANMLATKVIGFLVGQKSASLLLLLNEILINCPDQIPQYFEVMKQHVKNNQILLQNCNVLAQLPVAGLLSGQKMVSLKTLIAVTIPQSKNFLDQARYVCKRESFKDDWAGFAAPIAFSASLLQRCVSVFLSIPERSLLKQYFWKVKQAFLDSDKTVEMAQLFLDHLEGKVESPKDQRKNLIAALSSCLLYLNAYFRFSPLLISSFAAIDEIIQRSAQVAEGDEKCMKLRKILARFCLSIASSRKWYQGLEKFDDNLLQWISDEATAFPGQYAMPFAQVCPFPLFFTL